LKPQFEDFDITKIGYVTKNQFCRILKQFDLVPPTEKLLNLVLKKYMDRGNLADVNYYEFIRDIDRYNEIGHALSKSHTDTFQSYSYKPRQSKATIRHQAPNDLDDLLSRLRRIIKEKRIRVSEFMRDFDKLRHGNITKDQLRLAMNMAKLPLSETEFKSICEGFACEGKANYVNWKDFCDSLDEVFGTKELEKISPNLQVEAPTTKISYGRRGISAEELALANKIKTSFK
jgi:Ca2+-binding EF-hand superfamily protein